MNERTTLSLDDARAIGATRYFTGEPCANGHVDERYVSCRKCVSCGDAERATPRWQESKRISVKKWRERHRASNAERQRRNHRTDPRKQMLYSSKYRAKEKGLEWNLTLGDIVFPSDGHCPVLRIALTVGTGKLGPASPSLDRIDNSQGYIPGNVHVISWRANTLKNNATTDEIKSLYQFQNGGVRRFEPLVRDWLHV